jgi:hypothetical protein
LDCWPFGARARRSLKLEIKFNPNMMQSQPDVPNDNIPSFKIRFDLKYHLGIMNYFALTLTGPDNPIPDLFLLQSFRHFSSFISYIAGALS